MAEQFELGQRVRLPHGSDAWVTVDFARPGPSGDWIFYVARDGDDSFSKVIVSAEDAARVEVLTADGGGSSAAALAGMWTCWMAAAATDISVSALSASSLRPYAHQSVLRVLLQAAQRHPALGVPADGNFIHAVN